MIQFQALHSILQSIGIGAPCSQRIICEEEPNSYYSEQYKSLASKLLAKSNLNPIKSAVITSSQPGEGKTTTVCNLAITMAKTFEKRVLVIDGDLRRPSLNNFFNMPTSPGLTDYLCSTEGFEKIESITHETFVPNLFIIPAGTSSPDPGQLLNSDAMPSLVKELKQYFDFIIFDTSPVMYTSDAQAIGNHGDAVIFLVQAGVTPKRMIEQAFARLRDTGSEPDACILTNTTRSLDYYSYLTNYKYKDYYN